MNSNRFAVAVHILTLLETNKAARLTSDYIAGSVNTNPVVIRRIIGLLNKAGLVSTSAGVAGATLTRSASEITLYDVYSAVHNNGQDDLFSIHEKPNPDCSVGRHIQSSLETAFNEAQKAMEDKLADITLEQISQDVVSKMN